MEKKDIPKYCKFVKINKPSQYCNKCGLYTKARALYIGKGETYLRFECINYNCKDVSSAYDRTSKVKIKEKIK